ncbi:MAG: hypothetical protein KY432_01315, partial [Acidobacteria bacterium]|nr:hypothetical protein [Acidobacteriota bacterium]
GSSAGIMPAVSRPSAAAGRRDACGTADETSALLAATFHTVSRAGGWECEGSPRMGISEA